MLKPQHHGPVPSKSQERLLPRPHETYQRNSPPPFTWLDLEPIDSRDDDKHARYRHEMTNQKANKEMADSVRQNNGLHGETQIYRTYKRRWFGLVQLILLNIVVSWDWLTFAAVSSTSAQFLQVSENAINWLSTGFLFAFIVAAPATMFALHKGPKPSIIAASCLILCGNWIRYVGAKTTQFPVVMIGQILIGLAQPFVLSAPTTYSDWWFTDHGRTTATACASLANPLGGALGQLLAPAWVSKDNPQSVADLVFYVAIISSVASLPSFFIPSKPPTPVSPSSNVAKLPLTRVIRQLGTNMTFYLIFIPFIVYVGFFNATSALINQILAPYGFSEDQAGIAGGILIIVGIIFSILISILNDRIHAYVRIIKILVPITGIAYLAFMFAPPTRSVAAPYVILGILGAASFSLLPVALEYVVEVTFPIGPESSSVVLWTAGQFLGAIFTIIMAALKDPEGTDPKHTFPPGNMQRALLLQAIICCLIAVVPMGLGLRCLGLDGDRRKRFNLDEGRQTAAPTPIDRNQRSVMD